jgi:hypothetical protein
VRFEGATGVLASADLGTRVDLSWEPEQFLPTWCGSNPGSFLSDERGCGARSLFSRKQPVVGNSTSWQKIIEPRWPTQSPTAVQHWPGRQWHPESSWANPRRAGDPRWSDVSEPRRKTIYRAPLAPVLRGEGLGVRGGSELDFPSPLAPNSRIRSLTHSSIRATTRSGSGKTSSPEIRATRNPCRASALSRTRLRCWPSGAR